MGGTDPKIFNFLVPKSSQYIVRKVNHYQGIGIKWNCKNFKIPLWGVESNPRTMLFSLELIVVSLSAIIGVKRGL